MGDPVGVIVGAVGAALGCPEGDELGCLEGVLLGATVGAVGADVGRVEGALVGASDGVLLGFIEGCVDGVLVGRCVQNRGHGGMYVKGRG